MLRKDKKESLLERSMTVQRIRPECMTCVLKKSINRYPDSASDSEKIEYMQRVLSVLGNASKTTAMPVISRDIDNIRYELFGQKDEYGEIKKHFNAMMLDQIEVFRKNIEEAEDPLFFSMQLSLIGNYIDFAALDHVDENTLKDMLLMAKEKEMDRDTYERLKEDMRKGGKLVFITDNCGEIVLDRLMIEEIVKQYPDCSVSVIVRGKEAVNDATMEDAVQVGLDRIVPVYGNGSDVAATWIAELNEQALEILEQADIVLSKGQANFETLRHCGLNAYYLFLCKCTRFENQFRVPPLTGMLLHESDPKNG